MEYLDVIDPATLARAVTLTLTLRQTEAGPIDELAATAVMQTYCTCVTGAEDAAERRFSAIHHSLINEVTIAVQAAEDALSGSALRSLHPTLVRPAIRPRTLTSGALALSRWDNEGGAIAAASS